MRLFTLSFLLLIILKINAQEINIPYDNNEVIYTNTKEVSLTKDQLFKNAKTWIATDLKEFNKTIDMDDISSGRIILKYSTKDPNDLLEFMIMIDCKDKKYRYKISDIKTSVYISALNTTINRTMADYRQFIIDGDKPEAAEKGKRLNDFFINIGQSIDKSIIINDDF